MIVISISIIIIAVVVVGYVVVKTLYDVHTFVNYFSSQLE